MGGKFACAVHNNIKMNGNHSKDEKREKSFHGHFAFLVHHSE